MMLVPMMMKIMLIMTYKDHYDGDDYNDNMLLLLTNGVNSHLTIKRKGGRMRIMMVMMFLPVIITMKILMMTKKSSRMRV